MGDTLESELLYSPGRTNEQDFLLVVHVLRCSYNLYRETKTKRGSQVHDSQAALVEQVL